MIQHMETIDAAACIHCHKCRDNCTFLSKYGIDIGDTDRLRELAYHCFLCGNCGIVCPKGIDGRSIIQEYRRSRFIEGTAGLDGRGYRTLIWEKKKYKYKNYRHSTPKAVLFPGCNFPSMYPNTMNYLSGLLTDAAGIGTVYDCCGKPIAELGMFDDETRIVSEINTRMKEKRIDELVTVCPNCYSFLSGRLDVKVVSIYEKLHELGLGRKITGDILLFVPCPDRSGEGRMLEQIEKYYADKPFIRIENVQCCGLGGSAAVKEPELAKNMTAHISDYEDVWTYCATCSGKIVRDGFRSVHHILPEILGVEENPDIVKSMLNRVLTRFK